VTQIPFGNDNKGAAMVTSEREMVRKDEELALGERKPFDSSRQATYEDSIPVESDWELEDQE
jgi:hypothetical protein